MPPPVGIINLERDIMDDATVTKGLILKMGVETRLEIERFAADNFDTLLKKYRKLRDTSEFIDADVAKLLTEQIEETIEVGTDRRSRVPLLEMMAKISTEKNE